MAAASKKKRTTAAMNRPAQNRRKSDTMEWMNHRVTLVGAMLSIAAALFFAGMRFSKLETQVGILAVEHAEDASSLGSDHNHDLEQIRAEWAADLELVRTDISIGFAEMRTTLFNARNEFGSRVERVEDKTETLRADTEVLKALREP